VKLKECKDKLQVARATVEEKKEEIEKHRDKINSHIQLKQTITSRVDEAKVKLKVT
jgi:hypothetical protein